MSAAQVMKFLRNTKGFDRVYNKLNFKVLEKGNAVAEFKVEEEHTNPMGGLHGGFTATLVDCVSGYALTSHKNGDCNSVSVDIHLTYVKGAKVGDEIVVDAKTIKAGKTVSFLEVLIKNKNTGDVLVKGTHTKYMLRS